MGRRNTRRTRDCAVRNPVLRENNNVGLDSRVWKSGVGVCDSLSLTCQHEDSYDATKHNQTKTTKMTTKECIGFYLYK